MIEQGFTQIRTSPLPPLSGRTVSIGAVLANTSAHVAYRTRLCCAMLDNRATRTRRVRRPFANLEIPLIMPGSTHRRRRQSCLCVKNAPVGRSPRPESKWQLGDTHWLPATGTRV